MRCLYEPPRVGINDVSINTNLVWICTPDVYIDTFICVDLNPIGFKSTSC